MARRFCSVLQVKPFSGYYRSCPVCKRKLGTLEFNCFSQQKSRYWCRNCHVDWSVKELGLCYCLILTVTDYPSGTMAVSLFGRALESIFGLPATQIHKHLDLLEDGEITKHELLLKALRTLLIGACVELTFARGLDTGTGNGLTMKMTSCVASGVKILGPSNNETVFSLLTAQALSQKSTASPFIRHGSEERDTYTLLADANDSSLMAQVTQQNSIISRHDHNSSSFLYDTKSQTVDAVDQSTNHPLQLESFQETQSGCAPKPLSNCVAYRTDDVPNIEASQQIIHELESEWENSQQIKQVYKQLPGDLDFDLALSEEMVSELQQTFDLSRELESTPSPATTIAKRRSLATTQAADTTLTSLNIVTPLSNFTRTDVKSSDSTVRTMPCYGSPELFSSCKPSHEKQTHSGRVSQSSSFSPELFGPTPLVCRLSSSPANISATPSGLRSKTHTPKRSLLHDSTLTNPLCHVSQVSSIGSSSSSSNLCISTPQTQSKESYTISCTAASPDLFS